MPRPLAFPLYGSVVALSIALLLGTVNALARANAEDGDDAAPLRIAVLGDSLAAGYGLAAEDAFPRQLEAALLRMGVRARVLNHGVSGDTTAGGRRRVDWMLRDQPQIVIVELGANDALRGLDPSLVAANLEAIIEALKAHGAAVVLAGMRAPPNLGGEYASRFNAVYPALAQRQQVAFYPFFLEGVAAAPALNQADGIHPNAAGVARIVEGIAPLVAEVARNIGDPVAAE